MPGSGKTTISSAIEKLFPRRFSYISSGEAKREESQKCFGKHLSFLNQKETFEINAWFIEEMLNKNKGKFYLVDAHYTYPFEKGFVKLLPEDYASKMKLFVLFEVSPDKVIERRIARGRSRDFVSFNLVLKEIKEEREEALRLSEKYNVPLEIVKNEKSFKEVVDDFREIMRKHGFL